MSLTIEDINEKLSYIVIAETQLFKLNAGKIDYDVELNCVGDQMRLLRTKLESLLGVLLVKQYVVDKKLTDQNIRGPQLL